MGLIIGADANIKSLQDRLNRAQEAKRLILLLPQKIQDLDGSVAFTTWSGRSELSITCDGGDKHYATLFDEGVIFPIKPQFNAYMGVEGSFYRVGQLTITHGDDTFIVNANVSGIEKPPSCIVKTVKKRETVKRLVAECVETGETL